MCLVGSDNDFSYSHSDDNNTNDDNYKNDSYDDIFMIILMIIVMIISVVVFVLEKGSEKQVSKFPGYVKLLESRNPLW